LRVISGKLKGKRLFAVKGLNLRPTSDRVKEALFNILQDRFQGQRVLDLFAGTGALGIEALSRGAREVIFVEGSARSLAALRRNLEGCRLQELSEVLSREVSAGIKILQARGESFELIFLDPPYGKGLARRTLEALCKSSIVAPRALIVVEHSPAEELDSPPSWQLADWRKYGGTQISFFQPLDELSEGEAMAEKIPLGN